MIKQNIQKDLFEEMNDKEFIKKADEVICDLFTTAKLYKRSDGQYELSFPYELRKLEPKLEIYFNGLYKTTLEKLLREELGETKEDAELKLGGEA